MPLLERKLSISKSRLSTTYNAAKESEARSCIESWYNSLRDEIKRSFMRQTNGRLDRHKICACIYIAIVKQPLLKVINGTAEKDRLVNSEVAFLACCKILFSFMLENAKSEPSLEKYLRTRKILRFPIARNSDSDESYLVQTIKGLCHAQKNNELNALSLANKFCLIEDCTISEMKT